jgi:hypothetical protein
MTMIIRPTTVISVRGRDRAELEADPDFARDDGFASAAEFCAWWAGCRMFAFEGVVIRWEELTT